MQKQTFDFVDALPEETICPVCLEVKLEPYQLVDCGHHLCKVCLDRVHDRGNVCPLCREVIKSSVRDRYFERNTINKLRVRCSEKRHGCRWEGELVSLQYHLQQCLLEECACQCGAQVQRCHLDQHKASQCPQRPFSCEYCGYSATFKEVTGQHWDECKVFPLDCPNHCQLEKIARAELQTHLDTVCTMQEVACEFCHAGCEVNVARGAVAQHMADFAQHHMALMSSTLMAEVSGLKELFLKKSAEQTQLEQKQKTSTEKDRLLLQKEERISHLEHQLDLISRQVQQKDVGLQRVTKEVEVKEKQIKYMQLELEHKINEHQEEVEINIGKLTALQNALDEEKNEVERLQLKLSESTLQIQQKDTDLLQLNMQLEHEAKQSGLIMEDFQRMKQVESEMEEKLKSTESELGSKNALLRQAFPILQEKFTQVTKELGNLQHPHEEIKEKLCTTCRSMMVQQLASHTTQPVVDVHDSQDVLLNITAREKEMSALRTIHGRIYSNSCPNCMSHVSVFKPRDRDKCCIS